jgi:hypothetical protein
MRAPGRDRRWYGTGNAEIVPFPPHRPSVALCDRLMRGMVSRLPLAVQQRVDPDIGTPRWARGLRLRRRSSWRFGRGSLRGSRLQRLLTRGGLHDVAIDTSGGRLLSYYHAEALLRLRARWRPGHGGMLGSHLQRLLTCGGLHNVAVEPPGIRMLSHRDVEQWHRPPTLLGPGIDMLLFDREEYDPAQGTWHALGDR